MAELAVRRPLAEADLRDEPRLDPMDALPRKAELPRDRRRGALQRPELGHQHVEIALLVAGADLAGVAELPAFVVGHEQRTESCPAPARIGPADDHHLLVAHALELP